MPGSLVLDAALVLLILGYAVYGYRLGLARSLVELAGIALGAIVAVFAIPLVGSWIPEPNWRLAASLAAILLLLVGGHMVGAAVGRAIARRMKGRGLRRFDRVFGAIASGVIAALIISTLASGVALLGVPVLSPAIASSRVLRTIDALTPGAAKSFLATLRSVTVDEGLPRIVAALGGRGDETIPDLDTGSGTLGVAGMSVVRITGNAYACGQNQSGSGFVVAQDRVITNAHVVAGVEEPVVEVRGEAAYTGRLVYFDPIDDLAVIAVDGLSADPLELADTLQAGSASVTAGYPLGGPYDAQPARVVSVDTVTVEDIYGETSTSREVYRLAARVQEGNSGGPLLTEAGEAAGLVFAKGASDANIGFAMTIGEIAPVVEQARTLDDAVSSGSCVRG